MLRRRRFGAVAVSAILLAITTTSTAEAQGITTGAIGGIVTDSSGNPVSAAQIQVVNRTTGFTSGVPTRESGRYLLQGLEVGGPYTVTVRRIGFQPVSRENVFVSLSQTTPVDFRLAQQAAQLAGVQVVATTSDFSGSRTGVETTVNDTLIQRIPSLNRDFTDLVKLSPHVQDVSGGGPSAAGAYNRFNNFTIDGANQNDRFNLGSSEGVPGGANNGRLISIDAIKQFQVLLTPADVRHGNFAGMLVNAVTKSGTNTFTGGATFAYRDPKMAADEPFLRNSDFKVQQFGFYLGGPIIKDRLHFFIAPEFQSRTQPAVGPYLGQTPPEAGSFDADTLARVAAAVNPLFPIGSTGLYPIENPLTNLSGRLDFQLSSAHRLVFRQLVNSAENGSFSRNNRTFNSGAGQQNSGFRFTSNAFVGENKNNSSVVQLYSNFAGGSSNELLVGYNTIKDERIVSVRSPEISVRAQPLGTADGTQGVITFGTEQFSPGNLLEQKILEVANNFSVPLGSHTLTVGGRFEHNDIFNNFAQRSFGVYAFNSIEDLEAGIPLSYSLGYSNGGDIAADFRVAQYSAYAQDNWAVTDRFSVTYGVRADIPHFLDEPKQNPDIAAAFVAAGLPAVNTSTKPKTQVLWSPRIGFNWDPTGDRKNQVRGTIGIFTGLAPLIMIGNAYANTGLGLVTLNCTGADVPEFTTDVSALPRSCLGQSVPAPGQAGTAGINITDPDFKFPQNFTTSFGFDRALPYDFILTFEGLYRKAINGVLVRDRNLRGPRIVNGEPYRDLNGRVLYADTISISGSVTNTNQRVITRIGTPGVNFTEGVIEVTNQSKDYNYSLATQLRRRFGQAVDLSASYTYMQAKDIQSLTSDRAISNWRNGSQYIGLETDQPVTTSVFQRPHRLSVSGTYTAPWKNFATDLSVYYSGSTGAPIVYTANGDLNGDGFNGNDPIYIPRDAEDPNEIQLGAALDPSAAVSVTNPFVYSATQAAAFEKFISDNECLNEQRGKIMERNSCQNPWSNRFDVSLRQSLPEFRGNRLTLQLDIFNFANLLNDEWGQTELPLLSPTFPQQQALTVRGRSPGPLSTSQPLFSFDTRLAQDSYVKQQTVAGNFYQMQVTVKYSF